ncbi:ricin-type beta-trefoil lectin domain protein [Micromonospora sp. WMMD1128]|uniref:glycoside hydrolase family 27 protein n=1 Tax=unclassified Micromonospora TaxID=2617518 RepID=UPI00248BCEF7|nr:MULTISPECIES: ricin-type beta-trefoil lectin domain protein [unclassified Micromonospora]WBB75547.1 ricin-type beta-trefoil lectin domain protein [Micromonospora sp. WMMD1128]WFE31062.1 ricin-type beta-trefoil lectin domain protein [Micromonospora sp. WMMD975]
MRGPIERVVAAVALALAATAVAPTPAGAATAEATATEAATEAAAVTPEPVVSRPPMGWASWNTFAAKINYNVIKAQVDSLVSSGLAAAGYEYVNIDEGWWQGTRDAAGNITVDTAEWPGGMSAIADYIHSKGLKAGIYTDAGRDGCGYYYPTGRPAAPGSGSEGHYDQDFLAFSRWGFDFVKVDWCGGSAEGLNPRTAYQAISDSIARATAQTGRPMVLSVCNWGVQSPWDWAPGMSTMWRTSGDIIYYGQQPSMDRVLANFDSAQHPAAQSVGHYNDPDMLVAGMPGFSAAQNRTHLSLWAISGAPLLAGNNLTTMSAETRAILGNPEVVAIDQDPLGRQGVKVAEDAAGLQVYSKVLATGGRRAVMLLNRTGSTANITTRFADLGLGASATVRNVWSATDLGARTTSYTASVPAREAVLLVVTGTENPGGGARTGSLVGRQSGRCLDINNFATTNGTQAQLWDCTGASNQTWTYTAGRQLMIYGNKCLDAYNAGTTNGTRVVIWDCNGQANQQWNVNSDGTIRGAQSGLCVDASGAATANGTKILLWTCGTADNQRWNWR